MLKTFLSSLSGSIAPGLFAALVMAIFTGGYVRGCSMATTQGEAALERLKREYAEERRQAADTYAEAVTEALEEYRREVARGDALAAKLTASEKTRATETRNLRRQIADATKGSSFTLGPDVVRLLNEAAGTCVPDAAGPGSIRTAGLDGRGGTGTAPCAGFLDRFDGVTEADLAAWFIAYARRTRWLEERLAGWQRLHAALGKEE